MRVEKNKQGLWALMDGQREVSTHASNREAWRAYDVLACEAKSRSEDVSDWVAKKSGSAE